MVWRSWRKNKPAGGQAGGDQGRPLESREVSIETISAVTTRTGRSVQAQLDTGISPRGIKIPDKAMKAFETSHLHRHRFHETGTA